MAAAGVLEEGNVVGCRAARDPARSEIIEVAAHVALLDRTACDRRQDVADAVEGRLAPVHEYQRTLRAVVVCLAGLRRVAADEIEMRAGFQVRALDQRRVRARAARD